MNIRKPIDRGIAPGRTIALALAFTALVCAPGTAAARDTAVAISAGGTTSCAVTAEGGAECWGDNSFGQVGNGEAGSNLHQKTPARVKELRTGVVTISTGDDHTCAVVLNPRTNAQGLRCWGDNESGQLGDGTSNNSPVPIAVAGLNKKVVAVGSGELFTCALVQNTKAGSNGVKCWGDNTYGELGDGTTDNKALPVDVTGLQSGVAAISVGRIHACAVTETGAAKCWGSNFAGQIGDGTKNNAVTPFEVFASGIKAVAAGSFDTCALNLQGGVTCWGSNGAGELGNGGIGGESLTPMPVIGLKGVSAIAAGQSHNCAIIERSGRVMCWGDDNEGELGDGPGPHQQQNKPTPVAVVQLGSGIAAIDLGELHSCALLAQPGSIKCWGWGVHGQIGDNTDGPGNDKISPTRVHGF